MNCVDLSNSIRSKFKATNKSNALRGKKYGAAINDADYLIYPKINGSRVMCPAYKSWFSMIERCFSDRFKKIKPTYTDVCVCDEWLSFMSFRSWWEANAVDGWALDKDLLVVGNDKYSGETCIFVPPWLNAFTITSGASRGSLPIGVTFSREKGLYQAQCNNPISKKRGHIGYYKTSESAYDAWLSRKLELALSLKPKMDEIDERIYPNVIAIVNRAK